jgi:aldose 1-epimerase
MKSLMPAAAVALMLAAASCGGKHETARTISGLDPDAFSDTRDGKPVALYTLTNNNGMEVCVTNFGGRIVSLTVPGRDGQPRDVVLGFDSIQAYYPENNQTDFGAAIGRYANRIDHGRLPVGGDTIQLPVNNFGHTLHGGPEGWQYKVYDVVSSTDSTLTLAMDSPDGDNGFPGNVKATVTYTLGADNRLAIDYAATTDAPTVINMTNHSYFNLSGDASQPVTDDLLMVNASGYTPVDSTFMTTGEILAVEGTPMDFRQARPIGTNIKDFDNVQIKNANGYDHNYVLDTNGDITVPATVLTSPASGITLTVYTDEPGIQVYSGNFLDGTVTGKGGTTYNQHAGICLETQKYPDTPNKPQWPSASLTPDRPYESHTVLEFTTEK